MEMDMGMVWHISPFPSSWLYDITPPLTFKSTDIVRPELSLLCEGYVLCVGVEGGHDDDDLCCPPGHQLEATGVRRGSFCYRAARQAGVDRGTCGNRDRGQNCIHYSPTMNGFNLFSTKL